MSRSSPSSHDLVLSPPQASFTFLFSSFSRAWVQVRRQTSGAFFFEFSGGNCGKGSIQGLVEPWDPGVGPLIGTGGNNLGIVVPLGFKSSGWNGISVAVGIGRRKMNASRPLRSNLPFGSFCTKPNRFNPPLSPIKSLFTQRPVLGS